MSNPNLKAEPAIRPAERSEFPPDTLSTIEAMDVVFEFADSMVGGFHPDTQDAWRAWLVQIKNVVRTELPARILVTKIDTI
jgi:hypothetical protein